MARPRAGPEAREGSKREPGGPGNQLQRPACNGISGLVVEYIVAIDVTRVRFPADASLARPTALEFDQRRQTKVKKQLFESPTTSKIASTNTSRALPTHSQALPTHFPRASRTLFTHFRRTSLTTARRFVHLRFFPIACCCCQNKFESLGQGCTTELAHSVNDAKNHASTGGY